MKLIDKNVALSIIEKRQKALCPMGLYGRKYVDSSVMAAWDEFEDLIVEINAIHTIDTEDLDIGSIRGRGHGQLVSTGYDEIYSEFGNCTVCGAGNQIGNEYCCECGVEIDGVIRNEID